MKCKLTSHHDASYVAPKKCSHTVSHVCALGMRKKYIHIALVLQSIKKIQLMNYTSRANLNAFSNNFIPVVIKKIKSLIDTYVSHQR